MKKPVSTHGVCATEVQKGREQGSIAPRKLLRFQKYQKIFWDEKNEEEKEKNEKIKNIKRKKNKNTKKNLCKSKKMSNFLIESTTVLTGKKSNKQGGYP